MKLLIVRHTGLTETVGAWLDAVFRCALSSLILLSSINKEHCKHWRQASVNAKLRTAVHSVDRFLPLRVAFHSLRALMRSIPMYGRRTSGTRTLPSACW